MALKDKEKRKQYQKEYYQNHKISYDPVKYKQNEAKLWANQLKYRMGITPEQYEELLKEQNGVCAICKEFNKRKDRIIRFDVDHCHRTGRVRGLLCNNCNQALGRIKDSIPNLKTAIGYLEKYLG